MTFTAVGAACSTVMVYSSAFSGLSFMLGQEGSPHFTVMTVPSATGISAVRLYSVPSTLVRTWKFLLLAVGVTTTLLTSAASFSV